MYLEARARASHHNFAKLAELIMENLSHSRATGAVRARALGWSARKRLVHGLTTPVVAPLLRLRWMISKRPDQRRPLLVCFPVVFFSFLCSAIGESLGYLLGLGNA